MESSNRLVTTADAARRLGVTPQTVIRKVHAGELSAKTKVPGLRGAFLFEPSEIEHFRVMRELQTAGKATK